MYIHMYYVYMQVMQIHAGQLEDQVLNQVKAVAHAMTLPLFISTSSMVNPHTQCVCLCVFVYYNVCCDAVYCISLSLSLSLSLSVCVCVCV